MRGFLKETKLTLCFAFCSSYSNTQSMVPVQVWYRLLLYAFGTLNYKVHLGFAGLIYWQTALQVI